MHCLGFAPKSCYPHHVSIVGGWSGSWSGAIATRRAEPVRTGVLRGRGGAHGRRRWSLVYRRQSLTAVVRAFPAHRSAKLAVLVIVPLALRGANLTGPDAELDLRAQHVDVLACPWTLKRAVAAQISAQSRQVRMQSRMSIGSATQASAHEVQNSEQSIEWRAAVTSSSLTSPLTSGCKPIIFESDIARLEAWGVETWQPPGAAYRSSSYPSGDGGTGLVGRGAPAARPLPEGASQGQRRVKISRRWQAFSMVHAPCGTSAIVRRRLLDRAARYVPKRLLRQRSQEH